MLRDGDRHHTTCLEPMKTCCVLIVATLCVDAAAGMSCTRRAAFSRAACAAASTCVPREAFAAQRGAEDAYAMQVFEDTVCSQRTMLGACKEVAGPRAVAPPATFSTLQATGEPESELVKRLLERSAVNAEANARLVKEKTVAAGLSGVYGPFAKAVPVMRADGNFEEISFARYDKLKDKGKIVRTATGLDACEEPDCRSSRALQRRRSELV